MDTQKKLYLAVGVLVLLGAAVFAQSQSHEKDAQAHSLAGLQEGLPKIEVSDDALKSIDRVVLDKPPAKGAPAQKVELKKAGEEDWSLTSPVPAKANAANVKSLLENLKKLTFTEQIAANKAEYERWGVSDDKALHATFFKGEEKVVELFIGDDGSRGQMTRLPDKDGVFAMKGFSKWLFEREPSAWRDKTMFKFDDKEVVKISIDNKQGAFRFEKDGDSWTAKHGKAADKLTPLKEFQPSKVDDLLRAYKSLAAMEFGDGKQPADVGLDKPEATLSIELKGGKELHVLKLGNTAEGTNRWAMTNGGDTIYSISSWSAGWATAEPSKFQKTDEKAATKPASIESENEAPAFDEPE